MLNADAFGYTLPMTTRISRITNTKPMPPDGK